jgi:phage tail sheath gpL-like
MPISFDAIPAQWRMPLFWAEVDPSMAGLPIIRQPILIVGTMIISTQKVSTAVVASGGSGYAVGNTIDLGNGVTLTVATITAGAVATVTITDGGSISSEATPPANPVMQVSTNGAGIGATFTLTWVPDVVAQGAGIGTPNVPKPIGTQAQADRQYGQGSEIASMFAAAFANNFAHEIWALPVAPLSGSTQAAATITFQTAPAEAGMVHLYIGGHHVGIAVGTTDTPDTMATELAFAINDEPSLQVTAVSAGPDVTVTCKTPGKNGNDITLQLNYYGKVGGQELPPGLTMAVPPHLGAGAGGVVGGGEPDFADAIANLGEHEYEYVALPNTESNTLFDFCQEWGFTDTGRWGWMRQLYGHLFCARRDNFSDLVVWGDQAAGGVSPNFGPLAVMAVEELAPTTTWEWAAAYAAKAARALTNDPARPLQTLSLNKVLSAHPEDSFILPELNTLSGVGLSTQKRGSDGQPMIMRDTTTYQLNLYSQSDDAYELVTTMATLARLIRNQRHVITTKFPRHKLANDGTRFGVGQKIVTPKIVKAELVSQYRIDEFNGLVEDVQAFKEHLIVERDPNNPNRLNVLWPPDLVNQLRIYAVLVQFRLQYNRGQDQEILR